MKYSISESMLREMIGEAVKKAKRRTYPNPVSYTMRQRDELPEASPYHPDNRFYRDGEQDEKKSEAGHLHWKDEGRRHEL